MDFNEACKFVIAKEVGPYQNGGYTNDPKDPGGETKWGISKRYHQALDIKNLTKDQAMEIYKKEYWIPSGAGTITDGILALMHFDSSVNPGLGAALHFLKDSQGNKDKYLIERIKYYLERVREKPIKIRYLEGWLNRCFDAYQYQEGGNNE